MSWAIYHRGEFVDVPFDLELPKRIEGRFPNDVILKMDESRFETSFGNYAVWVEGCGPNAVLAYCGKYCE